MYDLRSNNLVNIIRDKLDRIRSEFDFWNYRASKSSLQAEQCLELNKKRKALYKLWNICDRYDFNLLTK